MRVKNGARLTAISRTVAAMISKTTQDPAAGRAVIDPDATPLVVLPIHQFQRQEVGKLPEEKDCEERPGVDAEVPAR